MPTAIERIRSKNRVAAAVPTVSTILSEPAQAAAAVSPVQVSASPTSDLPPAIPCPICECPSIWSTVYEPAKFLCCDCDPPPGGWHWLKGGWSFVGRRLLLVVDRRVTGPYVGAELWHWESFPRIDWKRFAAEFGDGNDSPTLADKRPRRASVAF